MELPSQSTTLAAVELMLQQFFSPPQLREQDQLLNMHTTLPLGKYYPARRLCSGVLSSMLQCDSSKTNQCAFSTTTRYPSHASTRAKSL